MSIVSIEKVAFSVKTNKSISEASRLDVNHASNKISSKNSGGYNDDVLGTLDRKIKCSTCNGTKDVCYGHYGSYELKYPIIAPILMGELINVLKILCHTCYRPRMKIDSKNITELSKSKSVCTRKDCSGRFVDIVKNSRETGLIAVHTEKGSPPKRLRLSNKEIMNILRSIPDRYVKQLGISNKIDAYLLTRIPIVPVSGRVELPKSNKPSMTPDITIAYRNVIEINEKISREDVALDSERLQDSIDLMTAAYHSGTVGYGSVSSGSSLADNQNLASTLKDKNGLIRSGIMGRRVSHIARSVITGDANLKPYEISININIAKSIVIQEAVTKYNIDFLRTLVANGNNTWPGAKYVEIKTGNKDEKGRTEMKRIKIYDSNKHTITLSEGDVVHRHLLHGDFALLNRQPTLMAQSLAGMQVKVSKNTFTITLNPGSCAPFNADFDGDNMNCSFATTTSAINELRTISNFSRWTENHQNPSFTLGAFQDTIIGAAMLSMNPKIPNRIARKLFGVNAYKYELDKEFYSGLELLSMIIPENINMKKASGWNPSEQLIITQGKIIQGVMDKRNIGQSVEGSLFHEIAINNGADEALEVLYDFQCMIKKYQGYYTTATIGGNDLIISYEAIKKIRDLQKESVAKVECLYKNAYDRRLTVPVTQTLQQHIYDLEFNIMNNTKHIEKILNENIDKMDNNFLRLIKTESRGSMKNLISIFGEIGYIKIDGDIMPFTIGNRRYLNSTNYPILPVEKGYIASNFRSGLSTAEVHAAATDARESFISNALNTATAGTLTKNLNKCMDSMIVDYFYGVVAQKTIVQPIVFDSGFNVHKMVRVSLDSIRISEAEFKKEYTKSDKFLLEERKFIRNSFLERRIPITKPIFLPIDINRIIMNCVNNNPEMTNNGSLTRATLNEKVEKVIDSINKIFYNKRRLIDPTPDMLAALRILKYNIRSELTYKQLLKKNVTDQTLDIILASIMPALTRCLVNPCETIGVLVSYILGEPLTQYSLDSKHRSGGTGGQNVDAIQRIIEVFSCKPGMPVTKGAKLSKGMEQPLMYIHLTDEFKGKEEIFINDLEMSTLKKLTKKYEIIFEEYNNSLAYPEENDPNKPFSSKYINWCIRYELNSDIMNSGGYNMKNIIKNLLTISTLHFESVDNIVRTYIPVSTFEYFAKDIKMFRGEKIPVDDINKNPLLLLEPLAEYILNQHIRGVKNIERASIQEKEYEVLDEETDTILIKKERYILLNGINHDVLFEEYVDEERSTTNSIVDVNDLFGVSMAREKIVEELMSTIEKYSPYYCTLLADQMVLTGRATTIHRGGIIARERKNILLHASERSPFKTFVDASIKGVSQSMNGPTPSIMTGQLLDGGTGRVKIVSRY